MQKTHNLNFYQARDYETLAEQFLDPAIYAYIAGGAGHETTLTKNRKAFDGVHLVQHAFADFKQASTGTTLLGKHFRHPIMLAPVAAQSAVHPDGEIKTAQAANAMEAGMILSTLASKPMASVADEMRQHKWFQLYFQKTRDETLRLVSKAEDAGFEAIVVTLDTPIQSLSSRALRAQFEVPMHAQPVNTNTNPDSQTIELSPKDSVIFQGLMASAPTFNDIEWLMQQTSLPVLVKGVMAETEIAALVNAGISGLVVSNHGGRALDCTPASLALLPKVRKQVGDAFPLLFDGGVRSGYDVFKALALGADAVCIGRLQMYALAANGAQGVAHMLKLLRDELELCMALTGSPTIASIDETRLFKDYSI